MNVKTFWKGVRGKKYGTTYKFPTDVKNVFLNEFIDWLDRWKKIRRKKGELTKETDCFTTYCWLELRNYCVRQWGLPYIFTRPDSIEERFGKYRRMAIWRGYSAIIRETNPVARPKRYKA